MTHGYHKINRCTDSLNTNQSSMPKKRRRVNNSRKNIQSNKENKLFIPIILWLNEYRLNRGTIKVRPTLVQGNGKIWKYVSKVNYMHYLHATTCRSFFITRTSKIWCTYMLSEVTKILSFPLFPVLLFFLFDSFTESHFSVSYFQF